jgi:ELMO domain-containing protein
MLQDALKELWRLAFPNRQLPALKSELWKEMGWQNTDPATDFRFSSLVILLHDKYDAMYTVLEPI